VTQWLFPTRVPAAPSCAGNPSCSARSIPGGKNFLALPYAPHDLVFRAACVVVHSGGIGTTARVLRAGRRALVVPWAHDQPDNAARLVRIGAARTLGRRAYDARRAVRELGLLLGEPIYQTDL